MAARLKLLLQWPGLHDLGKTWFMVNYLTIIGLVPLKLRTYYLLYANAELCRNLSLLILRIFYCKMLKKLLPIFARWLEGEG
jgi:hypothetical protein